MNQAYERLSELLEKAMAFQTSLILFEWDNETLAPEGAGDHTAKVIGILSGEYYRLMTGEEMGEVLGACEKEAGLSLVEAAILKEAGEVREGLVCIPQEEYEENARLVANAARIWSRAKKEENFDLFAPTLEQVIRFKKKFAAYRRKEGQSLYDVMLDENEKNFNTELLDRFFSRLKEEIVPLLKAVRESGKEPDDSFLKGGYPEEKQREFAAFAAEYLGFDFERGVLSVSAHPFTTNLHNHDVRITTHYKERMDSALFSVIHEAGHGIYEQGIGDELTQTLVGQGTSMGMHESQSRFYENIIGRSPAFWTPLYGKLQELFPERLGNVPLLCFVEAVNKVEPGLIRTQADELTYSLHILIRYELEKLIVEEDLELAKLPEIWADKYEEYLGLRPETPSEGVLQDIHWSQGLFGYFPSYALGNAFGAQIYYHMKQEMDLEGLLEAGKPDVIREYLKEHIHKEGKLKTSRQIVKDLTGEEFSPEPFLRYLKEKYAVLYGLEKET